LNVADDETIGFETSNMILF